ncbi:MAG: hypothetical protein IT374_22560 [Polyangiaceae bacterium]|nr:hypothetical protein [Polyangiaceae bacterium]
MQRATVQSRCECQASLVAELDEQRLVVQAYARTPDGEQEHAPAHTMHPSEPRFDVGWQCGVCGRNVLRSFSADALVWTTRPEV